MGNPALASTDERTGDRYYTWGDERFWSVTTIIGGGVPKYLIPWATKAVADLVIPDVRQHGKRALDRWARAGADDVRTAQAEGRLTSIKLDKLTPDELAARWIKGAADRIRDAAADRGSAVHASAEDLVLAQAREAARLYVDHEALPPYDPSIASHMNSFVRFLSDWAPEYLAAEATVFNRTEAYAGTLDSVMRLPLRGWDAEPVTTIVDYKSGNAVYAEVALQNSAYARGEFIGSPDGVTELPMIRPEAAAVLHLTPKGYALRLVRIDDDVFDAFRFAREVYRWRIETSATVLLQEPSPPGPNLADAEAML